MCIFFFFLEDASQGYGEGIGLIKHKIKNKVPQGGEVNKDLQVSSFPAIGFRAHGVTQKEVIGKGNPM